MKAVVQRIAHASVRVGGETVGEVGTGLLVYLGIGRGDTPDQIVPLLEQILGLEVFPDAKGRLKQSVREVGGGVLWIPNFTLMGVPSPSGRLDYGGAASFAEAQELFETLVSRSREYGIPVAAGRFGAEMRIESEAVGPVTVVVVR